MPRKRAKAKSSERMRPQADASPSRTTPQSDPLAVASARHEARMAHSVKQLRTDPVFRRGVEYHKTFVAAKRAAEEASEPFRAALEAFMAEHRDGYPPDSEAARQFEVLNGAVREAELTAYEQHGFAASKPATNAAELLGRLRRIEFNWLFDLQEHLGHPRPTDLLWEIAEWLVERDPFLPPLPKQPADGRARCAALAHWCERAVVRGGVRGGLMMLHEAVRSLRSAVRSVREEIAAAKDLVPRPGDSHVIPLHVELTRLRRALDSAFHTLDGQPDGALEGQPDVVRPSALRSLFARVAEPFRPARPGVQPSGCRNREPGLPGSSLRESWWNEVDGDLNEAAGLLRTIAVTAHATGHGVSRPTERTDDTRRPGLSGVAGPRRTPSGAPEDEGEAEPALTRNDALVLRTMVTFDGSRLLSMAAICEAMDSAERLSERKIGEVVRKLIDLDMAERPEGSRSGARLTRRGRMLASKISD